MKKFESINLNGTEITLINEDITPFPRDYIKDDVTQVKLIWGMNFILTSDKKGATIEPLLSFVFPKNVIEGGLSINYYGVYIVKSTCEIIVSDLQKLFLCVFSQMDEYIKEKDIKDYQGLYMRVPSDLMDQDDFQSYMK